MNWQQKLFNLTNLWWLALLLILFFFQSSHSLNSDEGVILEGAWNLINGRQLYFDFFEFIPPASFYLIYLSWLIFGISYFVAKFISLLLVFFSAFFIFKISGQISTSKFNYFPPILFIVSSFAWPVINHNVFNIFFIIIASYFFIKGLANKVNKKYFIYCGLFCGLATLFLQQKGVVLLLICLCCLIILSLIEKSLVWFKQAVMMLVFFLLPLILLIFKWPIKLLYDNLVAFPADHYLTVNKVPLFLFFLYLVILLANIFLLKRQWSKKVWFLLSLQFGLLLSSLSRPDYFHLSLSVFPLYALIPLILEQAYFKKTDRPLSYLLIIIQAIIIIIPACVSLYFYPPFSSIDKLPTINFIKNNCQRSPYIYAGPFNPGLYFETKKLNPTAYSILITGHQTPEQFYQAEKQLEKNRPDCVILNYITVAKFNYDKNNPVDNLILTNYELKQRFGNNLIYQAKTY